MNTSARRWQAVATAGLGVGLVIVVTLALLAGMEDGSDGVTTTSAEQSLSAAVAGGDIDQARSLLEGGADPDGLRIHGFTPLMRAAIRDDAAMVRLLLDAGADLEATDIAGLTTWHLAAEADAAAALDVLIAAGADLSVRSRNGMNTLEHAAAAGSVRVIAAIAAIGVDLDAQSEIVTEGHGYPGERGSTALGIAARAGHIDAVEALLEAGASVDAPSAAGHTPLLLAIFSSQPPDLVSVLLDAGADPTVRAACDTRCSYDEGDALEWAHRLGDPAVIPLLEAALDV